MRRKLVLLGVFVVLCVVTVRCACGGESVSSVSTLPAPTSGPAPEESSPEPAATSVSSTAEPSASEPALPSEVAWQADGVIGEGEYPHRTEAAGVTFYWANDEENLYAALEAETEGWVSVGFDPESRMQGANFVFGYVQDGAAFAEDMFGTQPTGPGSHPPDEQLGGKNDVLQHAGREEGGVTILEFKIPLDSGDQYDKPLVSGATYNIILAQGLSDDFSSHHSARGSSEITLD